MNTLLLRPTDVLFFRDGRPMSGSLAGHTAAWPLPDVTNHALHAALHRADLDQHTSEKLHHHRRRRSGQYSEARDRKFGSLLTAGPFPVDASGRWFFPRPKDAQIECSAAVTLQPVGAPATGAASDAWHGSSLPSPLAYAVANTRPPAKDAGGEPWISAEAFAVYLQGKSSPSSSHFLRDESIADKEANFGIAIDPDTQTAGQGTAARQIYTAHYLRLREGYRLGLLAKAEDKDFRHPQHGCDLVAALLHGHPGQIVVGGQQRVCTAELSRLPALPLPRGLAGGFQQITRAGVHSWLVKWVLLSPAIWPEIPAGTSKRGTATRFHPGGWLPNWICPQTGAVLLRAVDEAERRRRRQLNAAGEGYQTDAGNAGEIPARLVAAIVPKPLVVTGWALPSPLDPGRTAGGGAKSTHLAVPAGAVYYFTAPSAEAAVKLAAALNWHGSAHGVDIANRRSTLLGEKGYGLGVCGTWQFIGDVA